MVVMVVMVVAAGAAGFVLMGCMLHAFLLVPLGAHANIP